jgi:signal transduction histidine kinase/DNA-binding response OmpR family regulator
MNQAVREGGPQSLRSRMRGVSIRARVVFLAVMMLAGIVCTSYVLISVLGNNVAVVDRESQLFDRYRRVSDAVHTFGEVKYWLTDLAVSQLVISERNGTAAEHRFREEVAQLRALDPGAVRAIEVDLDGLIKGAGDASDAYADGNRVVGNTLMAQARQHFGDIDAKLAGIAAAVSAQSAQARADLVASADHAILLFTTLLLAVLGIGLVVTIGVLRTIARPLKVMHEAVVGLTAGRLDVTIPTHAPREVAAVGRALELFRDAVGERQRLSEAERKQRQTLADAIETIGEGFALFDPAGKLVVCNTRLTEIFPKSAHVLKPGTAYEEILRSIALDSGAAGANESAEDWLAQQRRLREAKVQVRAIGHGDSRWAHVSERQSATGDTVVVFLDITEHMRREMELAAARDLAEAANVSKSQFMANMSHELRTPLNAIIGYSEMLKDETEGLVDAEVLADLDKIRNAGKHLLALINDVLDLSKIEAGKMKLECENVDLGALLEEVASTIKPMIDRNNNRFELERPATLEPLWADGMRLKQCLLNLLSNASKFTQAGTVTLAVRREGEDVVLDVRDTGIGIPPEKLDRLFQQFSQVDASTTRKYGGTGLGLAISREFCRLMGGDILVQSTPDVGSVFSIRLPVRGPEAPAEPAHPSLPQLQDVPSPMAAGTILVIDDSENDRVLLRRYLEREGFDVITAATGVEGLELLRQHRPIAVTLDIKMDYVDGWTVLAEIRSDAALTGTPVVMVSILNEAERSKMMGAAGFLTKPVDRDRLVPLLEQLTGGAPSRAALVVDDDEASRTVLRRTLETKGWEVREAADGRQAMAAVGETRPDLIFLDLMMPQSDGFQVLDHLRANPATADIPVLVVTAKDLTDAERLHLSHGVVGVLQKGAYSRNDVARIVHATKLALAEKDASAAGLLERHEA